MTRIKILSCCLLLFLLVAACDSKKVYEDDHSFEGKSWSMNELPEFGFEIEEAGLKNVIFKFRNELGYPYQNLYVKYYLYDGNGNELRSDLINLQLFDEVTGAPLGEGNSIFQYTRPLLESYNFSEPGQYNIRIAHYMRTEELAGSLSAGIRIEQAD